MIKSLDIIIVNWNSGNYLHQCIDSILHSDDTALSINIIIIDNASIDNSLELIPQNSKIKIIKNSRNLGFAKACNQAGKLSNADYLLFLNPDTIMESNTLNRVISFLEQNENKNIGICGVQIRDTDNSTIPTCRSFPKLIHFINKSTGLSNIFPKLFKTNILLDWDHQGNRVVDQVIGAFFLMKQKLFSDLNGFDERFFLYFEEVDFSLRAKLYGWDSYFFSEAYIYHPGGGTTNRIKDKRLFYSQKSRILYAAKHYSKLSLIILIFFTIIIEPASRLLFALIKLSGVEIINGLNGWLMLIKDMPNLILSIIKN